MMATAGRHSAHTASLADRRNLTTITGVALGCLGLAIAAELRFEVAFVLVLPLLVALVLVSRRDATTLLCVLIATTLAIPSRFALTFFAGAVTPSLLLSLGLLWLWLLGRAVGVMGTSRTVQPVRLAVLLLLWSGAASWVLAQMRPLQAVEAREAQIGLIVLAGWVGVTLFVADGIRTRERLDTLLRMLIWGASLVALVGMVQFFTGHDLASSLKLPGLVAVTQDVSFIGDRFGVRRVAGTTSNPIEFGVLMAMMLPLALHYARKSAGVWTRRLMWVATVLIAVGAAVSVSRSAVVGIAVAGLVLAGGLSWRERIVGVALATLGVGGLWLVAKGLLGTIASLFVNFSNDPSITHRTGDYSFAIPYVTDAPLFGRGFRTFIPQLYAFVDNQYLLSLLETGIVGVLALLALFGSALWVVRAARRWARDEQARSLASALTASICVAAVTFATFDALSFPTVALITFLIIGCAGAFWQIMRASRAAPAAAALTSAPSMAGIGTGITVVSVTWNSAAHLPSFLAGVRAALGDHRHEIIVADNGSHDDTLAVLAELAPDARVIALGANRGYAAGINAALAASRSSSAVLILNPDVYVRQGSVRAMLDALRQPGVGIVAPRLLHPDGSLAYSLRRQPTVRRALGEALLGGGRAGRIAALGEVICDPALYAHRLRPDWASGACLLVSRRCLLDVGPWDESFFLYSEETDFALRARDRGYAVIYEPNAVAVHLGGEAHRSPRLWSLLTVNRVRVYALRHGALASGAFWCAVALNELLRSIAGRRPHRAALGALLFPAHRPPAGAP
jgi:GT2 family glycosyltransferase